MANRRTLSEVLEDRYFSTDEERRLLERERLNADLAQQVYDLRTASGLSQRELAKRVRTTASVICRIEDADYDGRSLNTLVRIGEALGYTLDVRFVPAGSAVVEATAERRPTPDLKPANSLFSFSMEAVQPHRLTEFVCQTDTTDSHAA